MNKPVLVQIVGSPIACKEGVKDTWREVSAWAGSQLRAHFGNNLQIKYYDLFDADCPPITAHAQLPMVLIDGQVISSGGKIPVTLIRRKIETILEMENA